MNISKGLRLISIVGMLMIAGLILPVSSSSASTSSGASTTADGYWTGVPPGGTASSPPLLPEAVGAGCPSNITKGSGAWECLNSQYDGWGYRVYLRRGKWKSATKSGWGWQKALVYHNLWQQPMLDTIELSAARIDQAQGTRYRYEAYHYNTQSQVDQEVVVIATHVRSDKASGTSPDQYAVGVYTAFCQSANNKIELRCPDWVNSTL